MKLNHRMVIAGAACVLAMQWATAAEVKTAYIERPAEKQAHEIVEKYSALVFQKPDEAFAKYISKDYVDHSHLLQCIFGKDKIGYDDALRYFKGGGQGGCPPNGQASTRPAGGPQGGPPGGPQGGAPGGSPGAAGPPPGGMPKPQIRVNDEMVTVYMEGADIFRVHDGKITDHWDASPMEAVGLKGENNEGAPAASR